MAPSEIGPKKAPKLPAIQKRPTAAPRLVWPAVAATASCPETRKTPKPTPSITNNAVSARGEAVREIARSIPASTASTAAKVQWAGRRDDSGPMGMRPEADAIDLHAKRLPIATVLMPAPRA